MQIDLRTVSITPLRQTYNHIAERQGADKPASRYIEGTMNVQPDANFHYRPTWDPQHELFDPRRTRLVMQDWYALKDPRQFYYGAYTQARARMQEVAEADFEFVEERGLADRYDDAARRKALDFYVPLRHVAWGANMNGAYGRFFVRESAHAKEGLGYLFLAGGSGLSSPRSMVLDLLAAGCSKPITLVNGARSQDELYHHAEFEQLADKHPNFSYVAALSGEAEDSGWTGARGFVHDAAKAHFANDFRGHKAYLCGPPLMIDACISTLMQGRLFERDIYTEKFISAADAQQVRSPLFKKI